MLEEDVQLDGLDGWATASPIFAVGETRRDAQGAVRSTPATPRGIFPFNFWDCLPMKTQRPMTTTAPSVQGETWITSRQYCLAAHVLMLKLVGIAFAT